MPPQFSTLGLQMNGSWVESLTCEGADGRVIIRPPGLTDQPVEQRLPARWRRCSASA
jgi:hypothetical protein